MKKLKILSVLCALVFVYTFCAVTSFAVTGDAFPGAGGRTVGEGIIDDGGAVSDENGNSVNTKETGTAGDTSPSSDMADTSPADSGSTLGDTDGDGSVEGTNDGDMGLDSMMPDENISENNDGSIESGDTAENAPLDSMTDGVTDGESTAEKTSSWLGILITLIIVVAIVCLIIAFIPRKRS